MAKSNLDFSFISQATLNDTHVSPRKARLVVNMIRGKKVEQALDILLNCDKKTAPLMKKLLLSAVANADRKHSVNIDELFVKRIWVDEGNVLHRFMPRAQGRATPIRKRFSTIKVYLDEVGAK